MKTSFALAPIVTVLSFVLSLPTAYALGRFSFPGKAALRILILLPIIMPGMAIAMFLSCVFYFLGIDQTFFGLVIGHTLLSMPFMLRILATAFEAIPQDMIDARAISAPGGLRWCATSSSPWWCPAFSPAPSSPS